MRFYSFSHLTKNIAFFWCILTNITILSYRFDKKMRSHIRRHPIRQYLFLEQNSLYLAGKPRKATALLHFWLRYKKFSVLTKLRSTLKCEIIVQEKAKATDNADAYRWLLTHYCAVSSHFKEILPYGVSAFGRELFDLFLRNWV